jgi:quinol monooxygenase YgiN
MRRYQHDFVETYEGILAFGYSREEDERSLVAFLQKFSDDDLMKLLSSRMSQAEIENLVDLLTGLMKKHLSEKEYHRYFLKD